MQLTEEEIKNIKGLSEAEVSDIQKKHGYNELPASQKRNIFKILWDVVREPMFLLLVACGSIYLMLGDINEALMLLGFVFFVMAITIYQENKTERALEALKDLSSPRALVIREGLTKRIAGREVVSGDIIILREGDRVPADATVLWGLNISADESLLTGESIPVQKLSGEVYSGTLVVSGQAIAQVNEIGDRTKLGKIGKLLKTIDQDKTLLQKDTEHIVKNVSIIGAFVCAVVIVGYGLTRGDWMHGFLAGLTLAMAILPEEFPVVLTIFLAIGAWRLSKTQVLTRRISTIEALGTATVLCVDKTGTLTQNLMTIKQIYTAKNFRPLFLDVFESKTIPEEFHELLEFGILASKKDPFDPMERALKELGDSKLANTEHLHKDWKLIYEYPLSKELFALSHVWQSQDGENFIVAAKGAPEAIADLCHFNKLQQLELDRAVNVMAKEGLRAIAVAKSSFSQKNLPKEQHDFKFEFIGLIGLADPIRDTVPDAISQCYSAGLKVVMITGDYPITAESIAKQIGLKPLNGSVTGTELNKMSDAELKRRVTKINIFSRVTPEQKLRIVNALKSNGEIVAMTGDGVNDAPSLKSADIGVAMGQRGTDVARESSDLVIVDDDFSSIVRGIRMGRRIFDNLRKAMSYIIAVHVPIAGLSLFPILFNWPLILFPVHVVFLELIIDPACSIVFEAEPEEGDIMKRSPRKVCEPLLDRKTLIFSVLQGASVLLITLLVYYISISFGQTQEAARTMAFTTLIIANIALIMTNLSWSRTIISVLKCPNAALWWVVVGALSFLMLVIYIPFLRQLFNFEFLHLTDIFTALTAGFISIIWFEIIKVVHKQ